jgi:hypothetical protein
MDALEEEVEAGEVTDADGARAFLLEWREREEARSREGVGGLDESRGPGSAHGHEGSGHPAGAGGPGVADA